LAAIRTIPTRSTRSLAAWTRFSAWREAAVETLKPGARDHERRVRDIIAGMPQPQANVRRRRDRWSSGGAAEDLANDINFGQLLLEIRPAAADVAKPSVRLSRIPPQRLVRRTTLPAERY